MISGVCVMAPIKKNRDYAVKYSTVEKFDLDFDSLEEFLYEGDVFHVHTLAKGSGKKWLVRFENGENIELGGIALKPIDEAE